MLGSLALTRTRSEVAMYVALRQQTGWLGPLKATGIYGATQHKSLQEGLPKTSERELHGSSRSRGLASSTRMPHFNKTRWLDGTSLDKLRLTMQQGGLPKGHSYQVEPTGRMSTCTMQIS